MTNLTQILSLILLSRD